MLHGHLDLLLMLGGGGISRQRGAGGGEECGLQADLRKLLGDARLWLYRGKLATLDGNC